MMNLIATLRRARRRLSTPVRLMLNRLEWRLARSGAESPLAGLPVRRLLIVPSDASTLVGARGDEAMMSSVVDRLRRESPDLAVAVVVSSSAAERASVELGYRPVPIWQHPLTLHEQLARIEDFAPDAVVILGADIMDGYYDVAHPSRVLLLGDLLAKAGKRVVFLGFSFNRQPASALKPVFDAMRNRVSFNVRDPISLDRFRKFTHASHQLVADCAFMLRPDTEAPGFSEVAAWAASRRVAGDRLIAFNVHPMLVKGATNEDVARLVAAAAEAIAGVSTHVPVSWLLLPHDYRGQSGDDRCLAPLATRLQTIIPKRVHHPRSALSAKALKAISGLMDGVVTGRMHLAIASLGAGVPVAGLTYQDKFQGLFEHFQLPADLLAAPEQAMSAPALQALLMAFVGRLDDLRSRVAARLPLVLELSEANLATLLPERSA